MGINLDKLIAKYIFKGIDEAINELYIQWESSKSISDIEKNYIKEKALKHIDDVLDAYFNK